ncbi:MAG: TRAP transporter large permease [Dehalococcoidia bacterium]|jgi:tripartite ATP-independent transporter DctM subunit
MSSFEIGLIGFIVLFVILFTGMPIGFCMALIGFAGLVSLVGWSGALLELGLIPFTNVASLTLSILPLFVLMGEWSYESGLADGAYRAIHKALGHLPGGLAMSTVGTCAVFAACTGSSIAGAATMTKVALPSMLKYKYSPDLATGVIAAGGTLGILIPPSAVMIVYGIFTDSSIGKLFIGGVLPGIILASLFMLVIYFWVKINPMKAPVAKRSSLKEVLIASKGLWPGLLLAFLIVFGLWGGVFSPSEAGGIGAGIALLIILIRKGFAFRSIATGLRSTIKTTAMIFTIVIGAMIFNQFMTISGLPAKMVIFLQGLSLSPILVIIILMFIYIILGCVMDSMAMMLLTLPIVFPIISALGIDPILFGILLTINIEMALITPPIGMVVFVISGIVKEDISLYTIFRGIWPFLIAIAVCMGLIISIPNIALWLPNTMIK